MYHRDSVARAEILGQTGFGAVAESCQMPASARERVLLDDIHSLGSVIDRLEEELSLIAQRLSPILRSRGKENTCATEPCKSPEGVCDVSSILIELTRRVDGMASRSQRLRQDIAL